MENPNWNYINWVYNGVETKSIVVSKPLLMKNYNHNIVKISSRVHLGTSNAHFKAALQLDQLTNNKFH